MAMSLPGLVQGPRACLSYRPFVEDLKILAWQSPSNLILGVGLLKCGLGLDFWKPVTCQ
eukprot:c25592_g1_i1 orf=318-494(-)